MSPQMKESIENETLIENAQENEGPVENAQANEESVENVQEVRQAQAVEETDDSAPTNVQDDLGTSSILFGQPFNESARPPVVEMPHVIDFLNGINLIPTSDFRVDTDITREFLAYGFHGDCGIGG